MENKRKFDCFHFHLIHMCGINEFGLVLGKIKNKNWAEKLLS